MPAKTAKKLAPHAKLAEKDDAAPVNVLTPVGYTAPVPETTSVQVGHASTTTGAVGVV